MFKSLTKLFRHQTNPTAAWPPSSQTELVYDLRSRSLNGVKLNAPIDAAKIFGPCEHFDLRDADLDLYYRQAGLILGFADNEFLSVILVVSRASYLFREKQMGVCVPAVIDGEGRRHVLTDASTLPDLVLCFGQPAVSATAGDEIDHTFTSLKNCVEASHDLKTGKLLCLNICETNDA
ncbi:MAG: hypothetical protein ABSF34_15545 [Verrucomicrobiota bacterium]